MKVKHAAVIGKANRLSIDADSFDPRNEDALTSIIRTFRENNRKLMRRIAECERQREHETHIYRRKQSLKVLRGLGDINLYSTIPGEEAPNTERGREIDALKAKK